MTVRPDFQVTLSQLLRTLQEAEHFEDVVFQLEHDLLTLLGAERLTIYQTASNGSEIVSWYRTGDDGDGEIRLPLSPTSVAGYVAMSREPVLIEDVYDADLLGRIHPQLRFDYSFDQTSGFLTGAMLVVPIKFGDTLLGVLQLINKTDGSTFSREELSHAKDVARVIGEKFRYDLKTTVGPYDLLIKSGALSLDELEECEQRAQAERLPVTLFMTEDLHISAEDIGRSLEKYYQVPFFQYDETLEIHNEVLEHLNRDYLAGRMWLPLVVTPDKAIILIDDPNDADRVMEIQNLIPVPRYEFVVGLQEDILRFLGFSVSTAGEELTAPELGLSDLLGQLQVEGEGDAAEAEDEIESDSAIVQLVNRCIYEAVEMNASDIHVEPCRGRDDGIVRMRVDGECREVLRLPSKHVRAVVSRVKVMSRLDIAEKRRPQSGKMTLRLGARRLELRVETVPTVNGESAAMRLLAKGDIMPFEKLNFLHHNAERVLEMLQRPHGVLLVVGPTGSGKTTTLHALLAKLNTPNRKILTAEDPVEITQPGLQQVQVKPSIGLDFPLVLRSFLRADPDIILIGEMRDLETARTAIQASLTGHLVFSTLHTNSAAETITRLLDMGLDPLNFADALVGVLAQRLMRTLCQHCKEEYKPSKDELDRLIHSYGEEHFEELNLDPAKIRLCRPVGCELCGDLGYLGRVAIHEILAASEEVRHLMINRSSAADIRRKGIAEGMRTLMQDGVAKVFRGQSDLAQLRRVAF